MTPLSSKTTPRRWTIYRMPDRIARDGTHWQADSVADPPLEDGEEVEVMPVAEHERLVEAARAVVAMADVGVPLRTGGRTIEALRAALPANEREER